MLSRRADAEYLRTRSLAGFSDVPPDAWAYADIMEATHSHAFTIEDGTERWLPPSSDP
jgi:hypothetical protein